MRLIYLVVGARPNFMKIAPIVRAIERRNDLTYKIVHTGQHYDPEMSDVFFSELGIPEPDIFMAAGGDSQSQQTETIMAAFGEYCRAARPDAVMVVGDVNSTLACSTVAKDLGIPVAHVEAGLRSGDLTMPEEFNRLMIDNLSDWFFVTESAGVENLMKEGKSASAVHYVGHVMVDNLLYQTARLAGIDATCLDTASLKRQATANGGRYGVVTLHRPSNVDNEKTMSRIIGALRDIAAELPLFFPAHPRTRLRMEQSGVDVGPDITVIGPQSYLSFLDLWKDAAVVLTDSGGLQEETTALGVPCITIRENTERPVTVDQGTNVLAGTDPVRIVAETRRVLRGDGKRGVRPMLWDGRAAERIVEILAAELA